MLHTYRWHDVPPDATHLGWLRYIFCINAVIPAEEDFWFNLNATWTIGAFLLFYLIAPLLHRIIKNGNAALIGWLVSYFAPYYLSFVYSDFFMIGDFIQYFLFGIVLYYIEKEKSISKFAVLYIANLLFSVVLESNPTINAWVMIFGLLVISSRDWTIYNPYLLRCINILDEYSYTVYLVHATILECVAYWKLAHTESWRIPALAMIVTGTFLGVLAVHHIIEKPVYEYVSKKAA